MRGSRYGEITSIKREVGDDTYARITTDHGLKVVALLEDCQIVETAQ